MRKMMRAALVLLVALSLLLGSACAQEMETLQVHQINVGCANAYLLICGDTKIMIDGGTEHAAKRIEMMEYLRQAGLDKLDAVIVTHYHDDHVGNIQHILGEFGHPQTIVYGPAEDMAYNYRPLVTGIYKQMKNFDEIQIGGMHFTCVGPDTIDGKGGINRDSLNFVLTYGSRRWLFTGDFVRGQSVIRDHEALVKDIDVFQFPHHGLTPYCVDAWVVKILKPEYVLVPGVSAWNVKDMMRKTNNQDSVVLDYSKGHVVILSDGESLDVHTNVEPGQFAKK